MAGGNISKQHHAFISGLDGSGKLLSSYDFRSFLLGLIVQLLGIWASKWERLGFKFLFNPVLVV